MKKNLLCADADICSYLEHYKVILSRSELQYFKDCSCPRRLQSTSKSKCYHAVLLLCGLEACPSSFNHIKVCSHSISVIYMFFIKVFTAKSIETVKYIVRSNLTSLS